MRANHSRAPNRCAASALGTSNTSEPMKNSDEARP
jgi:hypothetical protein